MGQGASGTDADPGADAGDDVDAVVRDWQVVVAGVQRAQRRIDEALDRVGVPAAWFGVLYRLLHADGHRLPMNQLAREVSMTSGGFTKLADRMARESLIDRRGSADDRRVVHAALTGDGMVMARRATAVYREALQPSVLESISRAQLAATAHAMRDVALLNYVDTPASVDDRIGEDAAGETGTGERTREPRRRRDDRGAPAATDRPGD